MYVQEYDNSLEEVISEVTVGAEEEEVERELKLAHIDIYNKGLIEREKRKRCVIHDTHCISIPLCVLCVVCSIAKQHGLIAGKQRLSGRHLSTHLSTNICSRLCNSYKEEVVKG